MIFGPAKFYEFCGNVSTYFVARDAKSYFLLMLFLYVICISMYVYNLFCYIRIPVQMTRAISECFQKKLSVSLNDLSVYEHRMFTTINVLYMLNIFCQKYY